MKMKLIDLVAIGFIGFAIGLTTLKIMEIREEMGDRELELDLMMDHYLELEERVIRLEEIASE